MKHFTITTLLACIFLSASCQTADNLKIVFIRHAEKPDIGDNLNCQGVNRSMQLPNVIKTKFGVPDYVFVPALGLGKSTKYSRMYQTVVPLAAKYNLKINTNYSEEESDKIAEDLKSRKGVVLVVWEHKALVPIVKSLGIKGELDWPATDFDSIWIVTYKGGKPVLSKDHEGIKPAADCNF
jgi:hypothetical protein